MSSSMRQRFMGQEKENRIEKFKGKVHMLSVCLNYEGTEGPLNCTVDGDRLIQVAKSSGVKDIVKLYDNGSTEKYPSPSEVRETIEEMASRCKKNDFFVFHYSGHGSHQDNEEAQCGKDTVLCLRERNGDDAELVDNDLAALIAEKFDPSVTILVLADACHSASVMDCDTPGIWGGRKVCALSGCQIMQLSTDTGDGGAMTNALLKTLNSKSVKKLRKDKNCSVQYVFNRMVEQMPDEEEEEGEGEEEEDCAEEEEEEYEEEEEDEEACNDDEANNDEEEEEGGEGEDEEEQPGQNINLSWPGSCDPSKIAWPF